MNIRSIAVRNAGLVLIILLVLIGLFLLTGLVDPKIEFTDPNLETAIREVLNKPHHPIFSSELKSIAILDASNRNIEHLGGLEHLHNLVVLNLENNAVVDLSPLGGLTKLTDLNLRFNGITNLDVVNFNSLASIPLRRLNLSLNVVTLENGYQAWLSDISVLQHFNSLEELDLGDCHIEDITPLSTLVNLQSLDLRRNRIRDISALKNLQQLQELNLRENRVTDLSPLSQLTSLHYLNLHSNTHIQSVLPLQRLTRLQTLILRNVPVGENISFISEMTALNRLNIRNCNIEDISSLQNLLMLRSLNLGENDIRDLSPLAAGNRLAYLNLHSNHRIHSLAPLQNLTRLNTLIMTNVPFGEDIRYLADMTRLQNLDMRNSNISDVSVLVSLMANGALQDNPDTGVRASVDLRYNPLSSQTGDLFSPIIPYWGNIFSRLPFILPRYHALPEPIFSHQGGYYTQPFELSLQSSDPNLIIRFTLDGSEPDENSTLYISPILIESREKSSGTLSYLETISPRWETPKGEVFHATVVRAKVFDPAGKISSRAETHTYFVDPDIFNRYSLPIVSITTDPEYFFDHDYGIYVLGRIYEETNNPDTDFNPWERPANYHQRGAEWERPLHFEFFEPGGDPGFSLDAKVRVHGGSTRERGQKSLRIYAYNDLDYDNVIDYELFPGALKPGIDLQNQQFRTLILRNSGNDWESTMFRDALMQSLINPILIETQAYRPVILFLNGEYWGLYNLRERLDEHYFELQYGIDRKDLVILEKYALIDYGQSGDEIHFKEMRNFAEQNDLSNPVNYRHMTTLMDPDHYIEYQVANIYFANTDWPHNNLKFWRVRTDVYQPDSPYGQDGRWRWVLFDTDFGFGFLGDYQNNTLKRAVNPEANEWAGVLFEALLQNPEFRIAFINRFADNLNTHFRSERVINSIDTMQAAIEPEMKEHIRRWRTMDDSIDQWRENVDVMRTFAERRPEYLLGFIVEYFNLPGTASLTLITDSQMGYVRVNTIDIGESTPGVENPAHWSGIYFQNIPIEVTAFPYPGYRFIAWEGSNGFRATSPKITTSLTEDRSLIAIFEPEPLK